jgi:RimJ/RimL family protein N-acetyltransferase
MAQWPSVDVRHAWDTGEMNVFAPLRTIRLQLVPITPEVARRIAANDVAGLHCGEGWPHEHTKDGVTLALTHGQPAGWLVCFGGLVIGDCGTHAPVDSGGGVEIGYGLAAPYRGRGFGSEVVAAMSDWLLDRPGMSLVRARTSPGNIASRRVLEKAGFVAVRAGDDEVLYERRPDGTG